MAHARQVPWWLSAAITAIVTNGLPLSVVGFTNGGDVCIDREATGLFWKSSITDLHARRASFR